MVQPLLIARLIGPVVLPEAQFQPGWLTELPGDGLQLQENLGTLNPEFAFAGSTTWGPVSRHVTNSRLEEPVFGRRIDTVDWPVSLGNKQAIPGDNFPTSDYPRRTPAAGSAHQHDTDNNNFSCSSPVRALTRSMVINLSIHVRMTMLPGSVDEQYTDPAPQSIAVQPDKQCDTMYHSERVIQAIALLSDELLATDSLVPRTVPHLSIGTSQLYCPGRSLAWFSFF